MMMIISFLSALSLTSGFDLPPLLYSEDALEPHVSSETVFYHYGKHHRGYLNNLNRMTNNTDMADRSLFDLVMTTKGKLFNQAAQVMNHNMYWLSMSPEGGGEPEGDLADAIRETWGNFTAFKEEFIKVATGHFASGYTWLLITSDGSLRIADTHDAESPLRSQLGSPILSCDLWEHAYYIDHRNARRNYMDSFFNVANWDYADFLYRSLKRRIERRSRAGTAEVESETDEGEN